MIPILYEKDEMNFSSNGLGRLYDCASCVVTEERNGVYECDFEYPVSGPKFAEIYPGRIIACRHDETNDIQPFDIVSYSAPINGVVQFHAVHISYRQSFLTVSGKNVTTLDAAFSRLSQSTPANPFSYSTDKAGSGFVAAYDGVPRSVRQLLGGIDGSILDTFHGEYEFDRFRVILHNARGEYKPLTIRYGVNMLDFSDSVDYSESFVSAIPYWTGDDGKGGQTVVVGAVVSPGFASYNDRNDCIPLDLTEKFEAKPTTAQLRSTALSLMQSQEPNLPSQTIEIDFVRLQDSSEYEQFQSLLSCRLCDWIRVVFPQYKIEGMYKVVKVEYDVLRGRYNSMELGNLSASLSSVLGGSDKSPFSETSGGQYQILGGHETVGSIATNSYADVTVTFVSSFGVAPNVTACLSTSGTAGNIGDVSVSVFNITTTGCTIRVFNNRGSSLSPAVEWIAVGV